MKWSPTETSSVSNFMLSSIDGVALSTLVLASTA
jgi:hypothetical protein